MTQEALKLALEALENLRPEGYWNKAITAIKEALAQTEHCPDCGKPLGNAEHIHTCSPQRTWVDLTNEDWNEIFDTALNKVEAIKLTKAKLKDKNT